MSQLFISHSSRDKFAAKAVFDWLRSEGFSDIFFDLDPQLGIAAGERWERALNQAAFRCEAVVFLVSKNWLGSEWCRKEHTLARGKNKALFAALIDETLAIADLPQTLTGTWQVADLAHGVPTQTFPTRLPGSDEEQHVHFAEVGLVRLRNGLQRAGLDPKYFEWPPSNEPDRPPYPGFTAFEAQDAGIFFGREAPLVEAMDKLRGQAFGGPPLLHVLLGASGAGKSSFLRAGLLPRLERDDRHFLPLPPIRPERAPILGDNGLLGALTKAFPRRTRASLRATIEGGAQGLRALLREKVSEAQSRIAVGDEAARPPALVIAVDQAEELFSSENAAEGTRFLELLAALVSSDDLATIVLFAIRSDSYDRLQRAKPLADLSQQAQSLPPLPRGEYARVIEGPAARVTAAGGRLKIDPRLTVALLEDLEQGDASDALPLLAFTLEHLWREFGARGELKREDYIETGRVGGVIHRAVNQALAAADADSRIPRDEAAREILLRRGFIPWLTGIDAETRTPRRSIARRDEIPDAARPLMDLLVSQRLLRADAREEIGPDGIPQLVATLEPAHEALLRQWDPLKRWLEEDFAVLETLEGVKRAARDWDENDRYASWVVHSGTRLKDALGLNQRSDFAAMMTSQVQSYLAACFVGREAADSREPYEAAARSVRDMLSDRWLRTDETYARENPKRVYYVSIEFLIGRSLANNVMNLMLDPAVERTFDDRGREWMEILGEEPDAGLGNGGLGRLAACFLNSMATLQLPAMGYGLRYEHGIFRQRIRNGWQEERPDNWLRHPDPWEVVRPNESVEVTFACSFELHADAIRAIPNSPSSLIGVPFDRPVVGYGGRTVNTLRLWSATTTRAFDFQRFSSGDFVASIAEALNAESLTRVLYPDDHTPQGRGLRLMQEYFLVACSLADIVRRFRESNTDWRMLPEKTAVQLNATHPSLAVPELMRILLDEARLGWDEAWDLTQRTLAYTNHTLLPEALERWPVEWMEHLIPRHLEIIYEINRRLFDDIRVRFPGDAGRAARISLVEEGQVKHIRMANLAIVGSHSTNGVAAIHSDLLRKTTVRDLAEAFPERFNNKTNGVTPRRWLRLANPALAETISAAIGDLWVADLAQLQKLRPLADDAAFRADIRKAKRAAKARFADWVRRHMDVSVDPDTVFDCQIKRIHEYKRQLLNALRIVDSLQSSARESEPRRTAAHLLLRRQGGARRPAREGHHQAHQQCGAHDRQRSRRSRQDAGGVPAGIQRVARRAHHSRSRRLQSDFDRRL